MKILLKIFSCLNICSIIYSKCTEGKVNNGKTKCENDDKGKYPDLCCLFTPKSLETENGRGSLRGLSDDNSFCKPVPYSSYYEGYTKEYIDNTLYDVECDNTRATYTLETCGNIHKGNPSKKECKKYSTYVDSCCYYSGENKEDDPKIDGTKFKKGCYWLGSKYEGSVFWAGARLECSYQFLKYSLFAILYLIIFL